MITTPTAPKSKRTRNPASTITVRKAFDVIRERKAGYDERLAAHMNKFRESESEWTAKKMALVPADKRASPVAMLKTAADEDAST